jgi:secondary thiamine-phosphate synthase enzyme
VQDFLLPTVAYIGGPSEISYFAQSEVLYRNLLGRMPVMLPRAGFTLVDTKAQRLLKQYGIEVEDVWNGSQELRSRLSKASVPENIANLLEENGNEIKKRLAQWSEAVAVLDPTLKEAVETAQQKIAYQAEKLQQKIGGLITVNVRSPRGILVEPPVSGKVSAVARIVFPAVRCSLGAARVRGDRTPLRHQEYRLALHHSGSLIYPWRMKTLQVKTSRRTQLVDISSEVETIVRETGIHSGVCYVYVPHTTAGVIINEHADPDVASDVAALFDRLIPHQGPYRHAEGNTDSHMKAILTGTSQTIFIQNGKLYRHASFSLRVRWPSPAHRRRQSHSRRRIRSPVLYPLPLCNLRLHLSSACGVRSPILVNSATGGLSRAVSHLGPRK